MRTVQYTADKAHGFQAKVITDGHVIHHPQQGPAVHVYGDDDQVYRHPVAPHHPPAQPKPHEQPNSSNDEDGADDDEYENESENSDDGDYEDDDEDGGDENGDEDYY